MIDVPSRMRSVRTAAAARMPRPSGATPPVVSQAAGTPRCSARTMPSTTSAAERPTTCRPTILSPSAIGCAPGVVAPSGGRPNDIQGQYSQLGPNPVRLAHAFPSPRRDGGAWPDGEASPGRCDRLPPVATPPPRRHHTPCTVRAVPAGASDIRPLTGRTSVLYARATLGRRGARERRYEPSPRPRRAAAPGGGEPAKERPNASNPAGAPPEPAHIEKRKNKRPNAPPRRHRRPRAGKAPPRPGSGEGPRVKRAGRGPLRPYNAPGADGTRDPRGRRAMADRSAMRAASAAAAVVDAARWDEALGTALGRVGE